MKKQSTGKIIAGVIVCVFVVSGLLVAHHLSNRPRTDDAFLLADVANIAPEVSGRIVDLPLSNNETVHKGDVLFVVDPHPYQLKLNAANAQLELATTTLARSIPLLGKGFVTAEQIDQMRAAKDNAQAAQALAERDFTNTRVLAPFDGRIIGLNIREGEFAVAGHPLFTLVDTSRWFAIANFRETQLRKMPPGTPAKVYVMAHPEKALEAHVDSIGWGVFPDDVRIVQGIPMIPKTLNWVRLAQRFPVRVRLDNPPADIMRLGASAVVIVHHDDSHN